VAFFPWRNDSPAWLRLLLLIAGDIEPNPGPPMSWPCAVCARPIRSNQESYLCNGCNTWVHKLCSKLPSSKHYSAAWRCATCAAGTTLAPQSSHRPVSSTPPPSTSTSRVAPTIKILQLNYNGLRAKAAALATFLSENDIKETKLPPEFNATSLSGIKDFAIVVRNRPANRGKGGGLAFLVHKSIDYTVLDTSKFTPPGDSSMEHQGLQITLDSGKLNIFNIYIPPATSCPPNYVPSLRKFLNHGNALIVGDFNAHHSQWHSETGDQRAAARGTSIAEEINDSDCCILNEEQPTRLPQHGEPSSPDITIVDANLALAMEWSTKIDLASDHIPIIITLPGGSTNQEIRRTYINYKKANWQAYQKLCEDAFANAITPSSCSTGEITFRQILLNAAKKTIPAGFVKDAIPNLPKEATTLIKERNSLRANQPTSPRIPELNDMIQRHI